MSYPWMWTAKAVINAAATECGLAVAVDPFASTDANMRQLASLLQTVGQDIIKVFNWPVLLKEGTIVGDGTTTSFPLPADFLRMVDPVITDTYLDPGGETHLSYRLVGDRLEFAAPPPAGAELAYEYVSRYWAQSSGAQAPDRYEPAGSTDLVILEPMLVVRALIYKFKAAKGLEASGALADYERALETASGLAPAPVLSVSPRRGQRPFPYPGLIPNTGYGDIGGLGGGGFF